MKEERMIIKPLNYRDINETSFLIDLGDRGKFRFGKEMCPKDHMIMASEIKNEQEESLYFQLVYRPEGREDG